jgi:hypothetical protein
LNSAGKDKNIEEGRRGVASPPRQPSVSVQETENERVTKKMHLFLEPVKEKLDAGLSAKNVLAVEGGSNDLYGCGTFD